MKDAFIALLVMLPILLFTFWCWGWSVGYREAMDYERARKADLGYSGGY